MNFQHHAKIFKKIIQLQKNAWIDGWKEGRAEGRTDPILEEPSGYHRGSNK